MRNFITLTEFGVDCKDYQPHPNSANDPFAGGHWTEAKLNFGKLSISPDSITHMSTCVSYDPDEYPTIKDFPETITRLHIEGGGCGNCYVDVVESQEEVDAIISAFYGKQTRQIGGLSASFQGAFSDSLGDLAEIHKGSVQA